MARSCLLYVFLSIIAGVVVSATVHAAEPPVPQSFLGVRLIPQGTRAAADTAGWDRVASAFGLDTGLAAFNPRTACPLFAKRGYTLLEVTDAPAAAIGLLLRRGYRMFALSRWYYVSVLQMPHGVFGTRREPDACLACSPPVWEVLDSAVIDTPSYMHPDYRARISFVKGWTTVYDGRKNLFETFRSVESVPQVPWINRDHYMKRMVLAWYVVVDGSIGARELVRASVRMMDSMQLDATYKAPRARQVACESADAVNLVRRTVPAPESGPKIGPEKRAEPMLKRVDMQLSEDGMSLVEMPVDSIAVGTAQSDTQPESDSAAAQTPVAAVPDSAKPDSGEEVIGEPADSTHTVDSVATGMRTPFPAADTAVGAVVVDSANAESGSKPGINGDQSEERKTTNINAVFIGMICAWVNILPVIIYMIHVSRPVMSR